MTLINAHAMPMRLKNRRNVSYQFTFKGFNGDPPGLSGESTIVTTSNTQRIGMLQLMHIVRSKPNSPRSVSCLPF